jgi:hypothetical protein
MGSSPPSTGVASWSVDKARERRLVRRVRDPYPVRRGGREVALEQVRSNRLDVVRISRR